MMNRTQEPKKVLLISNKRPKDTGGRAEKIDTRQKQLEQKNWEVVVGHVPKPYLRSFVPSIYHCCRRASKEDVDVIQSMSNPMHLQVIGLLTSLLLQVPWIAEFRDPMVESPDREDGTVSMSVAKIIERITVHFADRVIWTDGIQIQEDYFTEAYPDIPSKRFSKLPFLGFEAEKFESAPTENYETTTITYAGSFYEGWIEPYELLEGFSKYIKDNEIDPDEITLQFYGDWDENYQKETEELGITNFVEIHNFVPHEEIIPVLKGSDIVIHIGGDDPQNQLNIPSKIWDYMGAKTPILAVVDPSFRVAQLIEKYSLGVVVHPKDTKAISNAFEDMVSEGVKYTSNNDFFYKFSRTQNIETLFGVLESVTENNNTR